MSELGRGGMGVVYVGEHVEIGKRVAIKVISPDLSKQSEYVRRFFHEARAAAQIEHPGIAAVFDYGQDESSGSAYFVMELLDGESLADRLYHRGALPIEQAIAIGSQVAETLAAAHDAGIVHRDLKPDNIFLVADPLVAHGIRVKVLDFGVAKLMGPSLEASVQTATGNLLGTPLYMSPEQASGAREVDTPTDIYSLGCVLFEVVTGRVPFPGQGLGEVLGAHQHLPPPSARQIRPQVPDALDRLIDHMLAKGPDKRPASMRVVASALAPMKATPPPDALASTLPSGERRATPPPSMPQPALPPRIVDTTLGSAAAASQSQPSPRRAFWPWALGIAAAFGAAIIGLGLSRRYDRGTPIAVVTRDKTGGGASERAAPAPDELPTVDDRRKPQQWIPIRAPAVPVTLGAASDDAFDPAARVRAPLSDFSIHAREVTWAELQATSPRFVAESPLAKMHEGELDAYPALGVSYQLAEAHCRSLGGRLPAEEEWEFAARGAELRPHPWGSDPELMTSVAYGGAGAAIRPVASGPDVTPEGVYDLGGNAQEWTSSRWRDREGKRVVFDAGFVFHAIRGLPVGVDPPADLPISSSAHRELLCAKGGCIKDELRDLRWMGFRCVR